MAKRGVKIDRLGQKFNMLQIIEAVPRLKKTGKREKTYWICRCDCGDVKKYLDTAIVSGRTVSCGCYQKSKHHGKAKYREYNIWNGMKSRCFNNNVLEYKYYGGRGITVCDRWRYSFLDFLKDMGRSPTNKHSIDRIDVNGNYEPGNCRWATAKQQANNTTRTVRIELYGTTRTLSEWAEELELTVGYIRGRIAIQNETLQTIAERFKYDPLTRKCEVLFNERDDRLLFEYNGVKKNTADWAREIGCPASYIYHRRLVYGDTIKDIATRLKYSPENPGQSNYTPRKRNYLLYKYKGQEKLLSDWASALGTTYNTLYGQVVCYGKKLSDVISERGLKLST